MTDPAFTVDDVPSLGYRIDTLYAYLAEDDEGEGLLAAPIGPRGSTMPFVGADEQRMLSLLPYAKAVAKQVPNRRIRLVRFDARTVVEEITPE